MGIISCGTTLIDQGLYQGLSSVDWDTTPKTATFTGVAGNGYFCNTSSGAFTLNLPAGSVGDIIAVSDYASTFSNKQSYNFSKTEQIKLMEQMKITRQLQEEFH